MGEVSWSETVYLHEFENRLSREQVIEGGCGNQRYDA